MVTGSEEAVGDVHDTSRLTVVIHHEASSVVIVVRGEVDLSTVGRLRDCLRDVMLQGSVDVMVDLAGVTFMDSAGLGALVGGHRQARMVRGSLTLVAPSTQVTRLLSITSLDRVFRVQQPQAIPTVQDEAPEAQQSSQDGLEPHL